MSYRRYQFGDPRGDRSQDLTNPESPRFRGLVNNASNLRVMSGGYFPLFMSYETAVQEAQHQLNQLVKAKQAELKRINYRVGEALHTNYLPTRTQIIGIKALQKKIIDNRFDPDIKEAEEFLNAVKISDLPNRGPGPNRPSRKAQEISRAIEASKAAGGSSEPEAPKKPVEHHLTDAIDEYLKDHDAFVARHSKKPKE